MKIKNQKIVLFDIDYTLFDTDSFKLSNLQKHSLYSEVVEVLAKLSEVSELGILSEGDKSFQIEKLIKTEIESRFGKDHIFIVGDKLVELEGILGRFRNYKVYLVDDRRQILEKAKLFYPGVTTVWVQRGPFALNPSTFNPDVTIADLKALIPVVALKEL